MLDIKILRTEPEKIVEALRKRNNPLDISPAIELDKKRRELLSDAEKKKAMQNEITKKIPAMKKAAETILMNHRAKEADELCMSIKEILTLIPDDGAL